MAINLEDIKVGDRLFTYDGYKYEVREITSLGVLASAVERGFTDDDEEYEYVNTNVKFFGDNNLYTITPISNSEKQLQEIKAEIVKKQKELDDLIFKSNCGGEQTFVGKLLSAKRVVAFKDDRFEYLDTTSIKAKTESNKAEKIEIHASLSKYIHSETVYQSISIGDSCYNSKYKTENIFFNLTDEEFKEKVKHYIPIMWYAWMTTTPRDEYVYDFYSSPKSMFNKFNDCFPLEIIKAVREKAHTYVTLEIRTQQQYEKNRVDAIAKLELTKSNLEELLKCDEA